jgi:glycosyltransferase 2 family protein
MKRHVFFLAKLAISVVLLGLVVQQFDLPEILDILVRVDFVSVIVILLIGVMQIVMHSHRWQLVSRALGTEVDFQVLNRLTLIGFFFNQTLPTSFGGDAVRIAMVRRYCPSLSRAIAGVLLDRIIALVALVVIIAISLPFLPSLIANPALVWSLIVIVAICAGGIGFVMLFGAASERLLSRTPIVKSVGFLIGDFRRTLSAPRRTPAITIYAVIIHLLTCVAIFLLARAMNVPLGMLECLLLVPAIILISALPISFAGWGVREGAMVYLLGHLGVTGADALAISIAFGLMLVALGVPGGLIWLLKPSDTGKRQGGEG